MNAMAPIPKRPVIAEASQPLTKVMGLTMRADDALLVGALRIEITQVSRTRVSVRVEAPEQPIVLIQNGVVKVGKHYALSEQEETDRLRDA